MQNLKDTRVSFRTVNETPKRSKGETPMDYSGKTKKGINLLPATRREREYEKDAGADPTGNDEYSKIKEHKRKDLIQQSAASTTSRRAYLAVNQFRKKRYGNGRTRQRKDESKQQVATARWGHTGNSSGVGPELGREIAQRSFGHPCTDSL